MREADGGGLAPGAAVLTLLGARPRALLGLSTERGQEGDQRRLLLLRQAREGRHRRRGVLERAQDRAWQQLVPDVGQVRSRPAVAILADLVTGEAAGLRDHELAGLELLRDLHVDLVRRAGRRAQ